MTSFSFKITKAEPKTAPVIAAVQEEEEEGEEESGNKEPREDLVIPLPKPKTIVELAAEKKGQEDKDEQEKLKMDLSHRPDASDDCYSNVSIAEFGTAMLRGMGWAPGKPVGLSVQAVVEPIEYIPRYQRLGLGAAIPTFEEAKEKKKKSRKRKRIVKPGERREPKPVMVMRPDEEGRKRNFKSLDQNLVEYKPVVMGKDALVAVEKGSHTGLYAQVVQYHKISPAAVVRFSNDATATIDLKHLRLLNQNEMPNSHPAFQLLQPGRTDVPLVGFKPAAEETTSRAVSSNSDGRKEAKRRKKEKKEKKDKKDKKEKKSSRYKDDKSKKKSKKSSSQSSDSRHPVWVCPHIYVRIVSKKFQNGKYYLEKVRVVDVASRNHIIVKLNNGNLVEDVKQSIIETALPKPGGSVRILSGPHKSKFGTLMARNSKTGKAVVQLQDDLDVHSFYFEDIAERSFSS